MNRRASVRSRFALAMGAFALLPGAASAEKGKARAHEESPLRSNGGEGLLRYLMADAVFSSGELRSAQFALGVDRTCELVKPLYEAAVERVRPRWRRIYDRVSAKLPYRPGNRGREGQLLLAVGLASVDLLEAGTASVREAIMTEALKVDDDSIDYEARTAEIERASSENRQSCGLIRSAFAPPPATEQMGVE